MLRVVCPLLLWICVVCLLLLDSCCCVLCVVVGLVVCCLMCEARCLFVVWCVFV